MAAELFNSIGGFSVGIPPIAVVDSNGNVVSNFNNLSGNVSANRVYANTYFYANGQPLISAASGNNFQLQYNNNGSFAGIPNVTFSSGNLSLGNVANLKITGGLNGYLLQTDGNGNLSWAAGGGGGGNGTPGGSNTQVQFNDSGSFNGSSGFVYNKNTDILSVSNIAVTANVTANRVNATGNVTANYFIGNGSQLTNVSVDTANYVIQPIQSNITTLGTLTSLAVTGNIVTSQYLSAAQIQTSGNANVGTLRVSSTAVINGQLTTSASNVTGNLNVNGTVSFITSPNVSLGSVANVRISGGLNGYVLSTDGLGTLSWQPPGGGGGGSPGGSNTQVQFNNSGSFGGSNFFTFDTSSNTVQVSGQLIANSLQLGSGVYKFASSLVYFATTASTAKQVIYSIPVTDCSGVEFDIIATDSIGSQRQSVKISSVYYAGIVQYNEYAGLYINGGVGTFEVGYNPGSVFVPPSLDLSVTPDSSNSTVYKMWITVLAP